MNNHLPDAPVTEPRVVPVYGPSPRIDLTPDGRARVDALLNRLLDDESWQGEFTDPERNIWFAAANAYIRMRAQADADLDKEYARVLRMLKAASVGVEISDDEAAPAAEAVA